jgi:nucleotide-binding universal stress UspA family protein
MNENCHIERRFVMRTTLEDRSPRRATTERHGSAERHVKLQHLLVPVDFTPATLPALRFANTLAEHFGSTVCLLHVIEDHPMAMGEAAVMVTKLDAELSEEATEQLSRLARDELSPSLSVKPLVRRGNAAREILHAAETLDADLIVLATHRRSRLGRLLWGSTAPQVERHAPCPVLVIRCEDNSSTEVLWQDTESAAGRMHSLPAT